MNLESARNRFDKEFIYESYIRIVYDYKEYDNITRSKMFKEIVEMYHLKDFLYHMCTKRELEFIVKFYGKKLTKGDYLIYRWEINELDKKFLFCPELECFYSDYDDIIPDVIKKYKKSGKLEFTPEMLIVSLTRINGELILESLCNLFCSMSCFDEEGFNNYLGNPLVHFYCCIYDKVFYDFEKEMIFFRDYENYLDELDEKRKEFGVAGTIELNEQLYKDFFYYGLNYSNPKVKKMYDLISTSDVYYIYFDFIDECRVLAKPFIMDFRGYDFKDLINETLYEIPCASMNGVSPRERDKIIEEEERLKLKFTCIPQNNAHVHKDIANKFYYYFFALLEFTNNKYSVNDKIKKIFKQEGLNPKDLVVIEDYLWEHREIIDEFIKENPYKFNEDDFYYVKQFKTCLEDSDFVFIGTDRNYAKLLNKEGKIYMVKGIRSNFDDVVDVNETPFMIKTYLLMFENNIIFTGIIRNYSIDLGNSFMNLTLKEIKSAIKYYHL